MAMLEERIAEEDAQRGFIDAEDALALLDKYEESLETDEEREIFYAAHIPVYLALHDEENKKKYQELYNELVDKRLSRYTEYQDEKKN